MKIADDRHWTLLVVNNLYNLRDGFGSFLRVDGDANELRSRCGKRNDLP
jgi:hypothetical protein